MQSKPPAAGLGGEDVSTVLGLTGLFYAIRLGRIDVSCFETTDFVDKGAGDSETEEVLG